MQGKIVIYRAHGKMSQLELNKFCQKLYGQDTTTAGGRYRHHKHGLLEDIPHRKLIRGVFIVQSEDADIIVDFLQSYGVEIYVRDITMTEEDLEIIEKMKV